jgi:hypothetical protein
MMFLSRTNVYTLFDRTGMEKFERVVSRNVRRETKNIHLKLATTCNKNEQQQQDVKINAELYTKWTKTIWNPFEEIIRRGKKQIY